MLRHSPSRNKKSNGIKVNHVVYFCLFLAICFWLIYQIKHFHDKKKEFDEKQAKISLNTGTGNEILRLGRKDIYPRGEETATKNEKPGEEAEGGEETPGEEEENKHQEEDQEQEDNNKTEEREDEGRGGGDDEIDEHDQDKSDTEIDREENFLDEEEREESEGKESEEKYDDDKDGRMENESSLEDYDRDGGSRTAHEAREEHYKADDASSAVVQDTQINKTETENENENGSSENSNDRTERNTSEQENKIKRNEEVSVAQNMTGIKVGDGEMAGKGSPSNSTEGGTETRVLSLQNGTETVSDITRVQYATVGVTTSDLNATILTKPEDVKVGDGEMAGKGSPSNSTEGVTETRGLSLPNGTETVSDFTRVQYATVGVTTSDLNATISTKPEDVKATPGDSSNSLINPKLVESEVVARSNTSSDSDHGSGSSMMEEITDATDNEKSDTSNEMERTDEISGTFKNSNSEFQHDPIDSSDSSVPLDETQFPIDLDTLPEIRTEGSNNEDAAAER